MKQNENASWRDKWLKLKTKNTTSFLVRNFPSDCSTDRLRFGEIGKVVDFFRPNKLDRMGKPFGFVRFDIKCDEHGLLRRLNNTWIGSYKIIALVPRYERKRQEIMDT